MTEFMQESGQQNQPGNYEDARNHPRPPAVNFHQQEKEKQDHKCEVNADFSSAESHREY